MPIIPKGTQDYSMTTLLKHSHFRETSPKCWRVPAFVAFATVFGILLLFHETFWSQVLIWWLPGSYTYGLLIFPISVWLIWRKRTQLASLEPHPKFAVIGLIMLTGCCWLLAHLLGFQFLERIALIGMLILAVWCVLGTPVVKILMFPLGFLFFAVPPVPIHDALVLPMMDITTDIAVKLLQVTGLSVFRDGTSFSIASGHWSVVAACSGTQYLTASFIIGSVFAYLGYRRWQRRLCFMVLAIVLPIIGNGLRVYMTVMIGHLSSMRLAVDVDHTFYGLLFFGLLIIVMFLIGSIWWESHEEFSATPKVLAQERIAKHGFSSTLIHTYVAGMTTLLVIAIWPGIALAIGHVQTSNNVVKLQIPKGVEGWRISDTLLWAWLPRVHRTDQDFYTFYRKENRLVSLYVGQFRSQRSGVELVDSGNVTVVPNHPGWLANQQTGSRNVTLKNHNLQVIQTKVDTITRGTQPGWGSLLIWYWYRLGDSYTDSPAVAKWLEILSRLTGGRSDAALIVIATPFEKDFDSSETALLSFTDNMLPEIEKALDRSKDYFLP